MLGPRRHGTDVPRRARDNEQRDQHNDEAGDAQLLGERSDETGNHEHESRDEHQRGALDALDSDAARRRRTRGAREFRVLGREPSLDLVEDLLFVIR